MKSVLKKHIANRNWHYTINRRIRNRGWDLRPWPNSERLFGFVPELVDLINQTKREDKADLERYFYGASKIIANGGNFFSQLGQEAIVLAYTESIPKPFYLEIGAFHPYKYSNTATLREAFGWNGRSVDPSKGSLSSFADAGISDRLINKGVGPEPDIKYFIEDGAFSRTMENQSMDSTPIELIGIKELVTSLPEIAYLSLDIEGGELEILEAYPWSISIPTVITVEHNNNFKIEAGIDCLLTELKYKKVLSSVSCFESWYVHVE
jgi:hypothetical protein